MVANTDVKRGDLADNLYQAEVVGEEALAVRLPLPTKM